jgi:hypothetical protein
VEDERDGEVVDGEVEKLASVVNWDFGKSQHDELLACLEESYPSRRWTWRARRRAAWWDSTGRTSKPWKWGRLRSGKSAGWNYRPSTRCSCLFVKSLFSLIFCASGRKLLVSPPPKCVARKCSRNKSKPFSYPQRCTRCNWSHLS